VRPAWGQDVPQPGEVPVQPLHGVRGRRRTPDAGDEFAAPDRMSIPGGQHAEHRMPARPADPQFPLTPPGPYRAEQLKP
jgi:hypothetical protein